MSVLGIWCRFKHLSVYRGVGLDRFYCIAYNNHVNRASGKVYVVYLLFKVAQEFVSIVGKVFVSLQPLQVRQEVHNVDPVGVLLHVVLHQTEDPVQLNLLRLLANEFDDVLCVLQLHRMHHL